MPIPGSKAVSPDKWLSPARIVLLYASFGTVWIVLSDKVVGILVEDLRQFELAASLKGLLFIIITAGLLYLLIRSFARHLQSALKAYQLAEQETSKLAYYDLETGLPNYNLLRDRLNQVVALNTRKRINTAVIYISLTGFKEVIDAHGHNGGSEVVRAIAERLVSSVRQYDTVARIHRDEFVLVPGGTNLEGDIVIILNKLQAVLSEPLRLGTDDALVPACFGIACFPADGMDSDLLLQKAHIAMNQARKNGTTYQYYSEELNAKAAERLSIETGLVRAMDEGEFYLCYQPKVTIDGKDIVGMEALVRWQRPDQGIVMPGNFIAVAEENGLIKRLGAYVLREACRQNKEWQDTGLPKLRVAVNLSAGQLHDNDFVPLVVQILEETGLEPRFLELELTESAFMGDAGTTIFKLTRLKEMGISISVDDFGTGYSSLSYLKHLPINTIKIDRSFVQDIVTDSDDAAIVDAIVAIAHSLDLNVIAEGVETLEQLEFLRERKCQHAQGYYFSRPLPPRQFEAFMVKHMSFDDLQAAIPDEPPDTAGSDDLSLGNGAPHPDSRIDPDTAVISAEFIGDITITVVPAHPSDILAAVLDRFQSTPALQVLPVVENGRVTGIINRSTFMEEYVIGLRGYAFHINHAKKMRDLMALVPLEFESTVRIRDVAQAIQSHKLDVRVDNICVIRDGLYHGVVDVNRFISAITDINLVLAKGANPLTGLPGNESIQREINERLESGEGFDIAYIDIDNFKPFNDYYGFQRGDIVIKAVGEIISAVTRLSYWGPSCFCGHIGGDDFIVITGPHQAEEISSQIIKALDEQLPMFHGKKDFSAGCYSAMNRKGELETFCLLSISVGIVNTLLTPVTSYAQLASIATEVKKAAKTLPGSSVVVNRRIVEEY